MGGNQDFSHNREYSQMGELTVRFCTCLPSGTNGGRVRIIPGTSTVFSAGNEDMVLKLEKNIYGTKQAPRV